MAFPQFCRLPGELRDLIWDAAAERAPLMHFFHRVHPHSAKWIDWDMLLAPDAQSGARNLVHLSLTCRAARAAVLRRTRSRTLTHVDHHQSAATFTPPTATPTTTTSPPSPLTLLRVAPYEADRTVNLALDLTSDIVCFGSPDASRKEVDEALDWGEWSHIIFSSARRFAVLYQPPVPNRIQYPTVPTSAGVGGGDMRTRVLWSRPDCLHLSRTGTAGGYWRVEPPFCPRCVANVVRRFAELKEFYLIVDGDKEEREKVVVREVMEEDKGVGLLEMDPKRLVKKKGREFYAYERTYFNVEEGMEGTGGATEALGLVKQSLVSD